MSQVATTERGQKPKRQLLRDFPISHRRHGLGSRWERVRRRRPSAYRWPQSRPTSGPRISAISPLRRADTSGVIRHTPGPRLISPFSLPQGKTPSSVQTVSRTPEHRSLDKDKENRCPRWSSGELPKLPLSSLVPDFNPKWRWQTQRKLQIVCVCGTATQEPAQ